MKQIKDLQKNLFKKLSSGDTTEKQAMSASLILAADSMVTALIFEDDQFLEVEDIIPFLSTKAEVSQNGRAYEWICEWVAQYKNKFVDPEEANYDRWGRFDDDNTVCIVRNIFDKHCFDNGFNPKSFLTWLRSNNLLIISGKGFTKNVRIGGISCSCVVLKLPGDDDEFDRKERADLDF